jgi:hypothetical protein
MKIRYLEKPMTIEELAEKRNENGYVSANVLMDLSFLLENDFETILDRMSSLVTGTSVLMDINYSLVAVCDPQTLIMEVSGDVSLIVDDDDDDDDEKL